MRLTSFSTRSTTPFFLLATIAAALLLCNSTVSANGCCSQDHKVCIADCGAGASSCEGGACWGGDKTLLWLPGAGSENDAQCIKRWTAGCGSAAGTTENSKCCGTLICGVTSGSTWWHCGHPLDICGSFGSGNCPSPNCKTSNGACVPVIPFYSGALPTATTTATPVTASTTTSSLPNSTVPWLDTKATSYCSSVNNLGQGFSAAIGFNGTFPKTSSTGLSRRGTDDAVSFLVGGNYYAPDAAEIEGKAVVLGNFVIGAKGTNSIGKHTQRSVLTIKPTARTKKLKIFSKLTSRFVSFIVFDQATPELAVASFLVFRECIFKLEVI